VVKRMLPLLRVLKQSAQETGLHIVTNTGYYGGADDKFVRSMLNGGPRWDRTADAGPFSGPPSKLTKWSGISGYH
jgi:hypothetical protein